MANCTQADQTFGPGVSKPCRDGLDFTLLFEQALLTLVPATIFLLAFPFRLVYLAKTEVRAQASPIRSAKLAVAFAFAALELGLVVLWGLDKTRISIASATVNLLAAFQLICLSWIEDARSERPSTLVTIYLLLTLLLDLPQARTLWLQQTHVAIAGLFSASLAFKAMLLLLETFEKRPYLMPPYRNLPLESTSGIISRSFLWWLNGTFQKGFRSLLSFDDLNVLDDSLTSAKLDETVGKAWGRRKQPERRLEFPLVVCRALWRPMLSIVLPRLFLIGFTFSQPFLIQRTLTLLTQPVDQSTTTYGYGLIGATGLIYVGMAVLKLHYNQRLNRFMTMFRGASVSLIYNRALLIQDGLYDESAAITLMSTDVDRITACLTELNECWARAVEVVLGFFLLALQLGWVCVVPIIIVVVSFFGARHIASQIGGSQKSWVDSVQKRIDITSSMLTGIRSIRMMGLGRLLTSVVQDLRVEETHKMAGFRWNIVWQNTVQNLPWALAPALTFVVYAAKATSIDTTTAFTSLSIITLLTDPAAKLLSAIPSTAASIGCLDRVQKFLVASPKTDDRQVQGVSGVGIPPRRSASSNVEGIELSSVKSRGKSTASTRELAIALDGVDARPVGAADLVLRDITCEIPSGSITMVIGPVASGKSTLLKTILGEAVTERGSVTVAHRRIAFCSQSPWLPSTSIKQAICGPFRDDDGFDGEFYQAVVKACALEHDLAQLPEGDNTPLGSGSTVLSGGQKQRVALARALYARAEIMLLDDVISALDRNTQRTVVEGLFGPAGICKTLRSTVILATHASKFLNLQNCFLGVDTFEAEYLTYADKVLTLEGGKIEHEGTYKQLSRGGLVQGKAPALHVPKDTKPEPLAVNTEEKSLQVAEANEVSDLARQTGDRAVYQYYFKSVGWPKTLTFVGFTAVHIFAATFSQLWLKWWANDQQSQVSLFASIYVLLAVLNASGIFGYVWTMLIYITPSVARRLHFVLLKTVMRRAPQSFFSRTETGSILNRFSQDMSLIETQLATGALVTITNVFSAAGEAALIATGSAYMAATIPLLIIAVYALQHVYLRTSRQLRLLDLETRSPLYSHFLESLDGLTTIRAFAWEAESRKRSHKLLDVSQRPYYLLLCVQGWLNLVLDLIVAAEAIIVVGLSVGLRSFTSPGLLGISLNSILSFSGSLASVVGGWTLLETSLGSIARLRSLETEVHPEDNGESEEPPSDWPSQGSIIFNGVTASHSTSAKAIRDISLHIRAGQKIGICGRTGSGKSSLVATLLGLLEVDAGAITIDGVDLASLSKEAIRERLVTVPLDSPILVGSVRFNVDPHGLHTDAAIRGALGRVGLWTALRDLGGLEAELTPFSLSHGQRQLLALSRAILRKGKIVLLDEPTSNVDSETDATIQGVLRQEFAACTILTVAHRIDTIFPGSDVIVVMDEGKIVEVGTPAELVETRPDSLGRFRSLLFESGI
ncbi:Multidrug resistance-associated protein 1 [Tolypocladium ophioglossoides CBS 100239]|uniref:Multidrug resistance-associated protein 1 n=1 Tax=Tolypocladium ophioglossoides (strain CBS 100239) TaxID=1163406 RepID=A0A0L0N8F2_TOLOC|nr:Multidrug resistance-associated protein 1 [Tolypocladium ophioglossoides CBS 100239]